ncbi:oxygen-independent coproporphyrinogen III oxidase [Desertibaculum subflavum]|uniref:oxygen-independent coproporphyrinogen III oxidase n=1 Tax=Desertibaculum subflavum TaxID=2268458 RepID=UPI0034D191C0
MRQVKAPAGRTGSIRRMRPDWLPLLDARIPRYTSYPTAPHFHAGIGPERYAAWLAAIDPARPVSLYLHVPYCRRLCWYCACNTEITREEGPLASFTATVLREIELIAGHLPTRLSVSQIHFGGGTPTLLRPEQLAAIVEALRRHFDFRPGMEFALEIDPRTLSRGMLAMFRQLGVTRASLGVQDLDADVQRAVNRIQPAETVERAVWELRAAGVQGINFDLLYGLPRQSEATMRTTVERLMRLAPDRIALFGYAHVPWMKKHQKALERFGLPDAPARAALAMAARTALEGAGLEPVGLDHFAQPDDALAVAARAGRLHRNFQGYTTDAAETLIGFGPSSISAFAQGYAQSAPATEAWAAVIDAGRPATLRGIALSADDRLHREVIEAVMCNLAVDLAEVALRHGATPERFAPELVRLRPLAARGLVEIDGWRISVPPAARIAVRTVAAVFDSYLEASAARHAAAV